MPFRCQLRIPSDRRVPGGWKAFRQHCCQYFPVQLTGLCDRASIVLMIHTFARVAAVLKMRTGDVFIQGRRTGVRLGEKGGKHHTMPCHHTRPLHYPGL